MGLIGRIFGSKKALETASGLATTIVSSGISAIDKTFYTDEEKADDNKKLLEIKINLLKAYQPYELVLRFVTLFVVGSYSLMSLIGFIGSYWHPMTEDQKAILTGDFGVAFITIIVFYFGNMVTKKFRTDKK